MDPVPWPADLARRYRQEGVWQGRCLSALMDQWATDRPDQVAIVDHGRRVSYGDLLNSARRMAAGFSDSGVSADDRIVVQLPNSAGLLTAIFALLEIGAIPVLAMPALREEEISHICRIAEARGYVAPQTFRGFDYRALARQVRLRNPSLRRIYIDGDPDEFVALQTLDGEPEDHGVRSPSSVALMLLSGGTTGRPKLIPRTHDDYVCNITASAANARLGPDAVYLAALPITHNYALGCPGVLGTFAAGGRVVMVSSPSPDEAFPLVQEERVTYTGLVPAAAALWAAAASRTIWDLSSLQFVQVGGAKLEPNLARTIHTELGCRVQQSFGMGEGLLSQSRVDDSQDVLFTAQGRPISPSDEVRIVDEQDREVATGVVGELQVRGPYTVRGYYRAEEHNRLAFTADGFFRSGDRARVDAAGNLYLKGRRSDVVNRAGEKVPVGELEEHLRAHPRIQDVAIIGLPDHRIGEKICAVVVPHGEPPTLPMLVQFIRDRGLATYKAPDVLLLREALPRTGLGKLDRKELVVEVGRQLTGDHGASIQ